MEWSRLQNWQKVLLWLFGGVLVAVLAGAVTHALNLNGNRSDHGSATPITDPPPVIEATTSATVPTTGFPVTTRATSTTQVLVPTTVSQPQQTWLSDLDPVAQYYSGWTTDVVTVDGVDHAHAWTERFSVNCPNVFIEFDLGKRYRLFSGRASTADDMGSGQTFRYRVLADDTELAAGSMALGRSEDFQVSVEGRLRLRLEVTRDCGKPYERGPLRYAGFVDPLLTI